MKNRFLALLLLVSLGACANPYRANYNSTLDRLPGWAQNRFGPPAARPRLIETVNISTENWRLFEQGYAMVGYSKFDGPALDVKLALSEAKSRQADIVLVEKKFSKTLTETAAVTVWPANETTEIREEGRVTGGEKGDRRISRRTEVTTTRGPETVYVPKQVDYYEHTASYWRKVSKPLFGVLLQDLTDDQRQTLQSNRGLVVKGVMTGSPAYEADILKGDILVKINGKAIVGASRFYEDLYSFAGKTVNFVLLRGKNALTRSVTMNP